MRKRRTVRKWMLFTATSMYLAKAKTNSNWEPPPIEGETARIEWRGRMSKAIAQRIREEHKKLEES